MGFAYDYEAGFEEPNNKNAWFAKAITADGTGKRVLEVGCATGYVGEYLVRNLGCEVYGVEYVEVAAEKARERGCYQAVVTGDIQDPATVAGLPEGTFDFVLFGDVLEHLMNPERALQIVKPLLKPGGRVLVCVPSIIHWSLRLRVLRGKFEYTETGPLDRTHVRFFTPRSARELMEGAGLRVVRDGGVVWLPSALYKLPKSARYGLERVAGKAFPNVMYGQVLLDGTPAPEEGAIRSGKSAGAPDGAPSVGIGMS